MAAQEKYGIKALNKLIPCKEALYDLLVEKKGYYLPDLLSKAITEEYLLGVARNTFF